MTQARPQPGSGPVGYESSCSTFRLSAEGRAWAADFRQKMKKDAFAGLEDAVAWVKEQSYLERVHNTSTIRVIR